MTPTLQELKDASATLPPTQRAELAHFLLQSLDPDEDGWAEAWQEELSHRLNDIRSSKVVGVPTDEVLKQLRERHA
jgi:putative addiction module component (TIGR02574 family)